MPNSARDGWNFVVGAISIVVVNSSILLSQFFGRLCDGSRLTVDILFSSSLAPPMNSVLVSLSGALFSLA